MWRVMRVNEDGGSGMMAFAEGPPRRLLLVTDAHNHAVHALDVVTGTHVGYVAAPGTLIGPRGVAAAGALVAVSAWDKHHPGDHVVQVFERRPAGAWEPLRVIAGGLGHGGADGQLHRPWGLRFTADAQCLAVADSRNGRVCLFRVEDGCFMRHVALGLFKPKDVEEVQGGWLVACPRSGDVTVVRAGGHEGGSIKQCSPNALAFVPAVGLFVTDGDNNRVFIFATPAMRAMHRMSAGRVQWMAGVARAQRMRRVRQAGQALESKPRKRTRPTPRINA